MSECQCDLGCTYEADSRAPEPQMCERCNGADCVPGRPKTGKIRDYGPIQAFEGSLSYRGPVNIEPMRFDAEIAFPVEVPHVAEYMFVFRNVVDDGWSPKALWHRLRRVKATVYLSPKESWADDDLFDQYTQVVSEGLDPEVWMRLAIEGQS